LKTIYFNSQKIISFASNKTTMKASLVGERLLNYEIKKHISSDELFDYYDAEHLLFDRKVVVKTLNANSIGNAQAKEQLKRESQRLNFNHNQTLLIYDLIETSDNAFLISEKSENKLTLNQYVQSIGAMTEDKALRLFFQILEIVSAAHQIGLIHPQLNAQNILIEGNQVKIKGFEGLDTVVEEAYQSPEEKKNGTKTIQGNIYSLGKILTTMLVGSPDIHKAKKISEKTLEAIRAAIENNESQRFKDCKEFAIALTEEVSKEEVEDQHAFKYLPLIALAVVAALFTLLVFTVADDDDRVNTLAYNLYDKTRIKKGLDSIQKVKRQEYLKDSTRIARGKAENLQKIHIHKVQKGESFKGIAEMYNMRVSHLKELNGMTEKSTLRADAGLRVVVREFHKVLDGEELWKIGEKYGVTKFEIMRVNQIDPADEKDEFYPGRELIIPIKR